MDKFGLLPPAIRENYERIEQEDRFKRSDAALVRALEALDPKLGLAFVGPGADPKHGWAPGFWHVVRRNDPPTPDTYFPIKTPSGGYREPDFGVLAEMQSRDMWRRGIPEPEFSVPSAHRQAKTPEGAKDMVAEDVRAAWRLPGEGGMEKRLWAKGRKK